MARKSIPIDLIFTMKGMKGFEIILKGFEGSRIQGSKWSV
jgi:hypothetical protein